MEALVEAYPSLWQADSLTVQGPVRFLPGVSVKGSVTLLNSALAGERGCMWLGLEGDKVHGTNGLSFEVLDPEPPPGPRQTRAHARKTFAGTAEPLPVKSRMLVSTTVDLGEEAAKSKAA